MSSFNPQFGANPADGANGAGAPVEDNRAARQERKAFIGGLPAGCEKHNLDEHFGQFGAVEDSIVMTDRATGRTRGFGFVTFQRMEDLETCLASGPHALLDKVVDVKRAVDGPPPPSRTGPPPDNFGYSPQGGRGGAYGKGGMPFEYNSQYQRQPMQPSSSSGPGGSGEHNPCKLFVGGLPNDIDEEGINQFFSKYGEIVDSVIMKERGTGRPRGFGYVTFAMPEDAAAAVAAGRTNVLEGRWLDVKHAIRGGTGQPAGRQSGGPPPGFAPLDSPRPYGGPASGPGRNQDDPAKVFVGGIPPSIDKGRLSEHMSRYGQIVDCVIMVDRNTGRPRGFGYCTFTSPSEAMAACNGGTGNTIDGHWLDVKPASRDPAVCGPSKGPYSAGGGLQEYPGYGMGGTPYEQGMNMGATPQYGGYPQQGGPMYQNMYMQQTPPQAQQQAYQMYPGAGRQQQGASPYGGVPGYRASPY